MPIFQSSAPPSRAQSIFSRSAAVAILIAACVFGLWEARACSQIIDPSAGSSRYLITFLISIAIAIGGFLFCVYWRTRLIGASLILAGILTSVVFFADFAWLTRQHQVAWRSPVPAVSAALNHEFSLVIYFRKTTTNDQIADFTATVLEQPGQPMHPEPEYPWFISEHVTLQPALANGFQAAAIDFRSSVPTSITGPYTERIIDDPRVEKAFPNVSPVDIKTVPVQR